MKARRANTQDPRDFVLVEELDSQNIPDSQSAPSKHKAGERTKMRILADDENVYQAQTEWKMSYRFVLASRDQAAIELSDVSNFIHKILLLSQRNKHRIYIYILDA